MIQLFRGITSAWRRDPEFRSLLILVAIALLGGTIFYSLQEGCGGRLLLLRHHTHHRGAR
jgi:hypothetical protein